jgi:protein CpxP
MRLKTAVLSTALASLLLATSSLAHGGAHDGNKAARMERKLDHAVEKGRLTPAQAEQFKAEARQLHEEKKALRQSNGGQLTEEQRQQFKQRKQALRAKVKAAMQATAPQGV